VLKSWLPNNCHLTFLMTLGVTIEILADDLSMATFVLMLGSHIRHTRRWQVTARDRFETEWKPNDFTYMNESMINSFTTIYTRTETLDSTNNLKNLSHLTTSQLANTLIIEMASKFVLRVKIKMQASRKRISARHHVPNRSDRSLSKETSSTSDLIFLMRVV
jgi:hypothetical protein